MTVRSGNLGGSAREDEQAKVRSTLEAARTLWLPEICFIPDLAAALQMHPAAVRRILLKGTLGPFGRLGRRLYALRSTVLETLRAQATLPEPPKSPGMLPRPKEEYIQMLRPRPRGRAANRGAAGRAPEREGGGKDPDLKGGAK